MERAQPTWQLRIPSWAIGLFVVALSIPVGIFVRTVGTASAQAKLHSENPNVREAAARALGSMGPKAVAAVPNLLSALRNDSPQVAASAACALGNIYHLSQRRRVWPGNREVVAALIEGLDHKDGEVRRYAAYAISLIGPSAGSAIPKLIQTLDDEHMSYMAARALGEMGPAARNSIPVMTALLSRPHAGERAEAAIALSRLGPLPAESTIAIERLLQDKEELVRNAARTAISMRQHKE